VKCYFERHSNSRTAGLHIFISQTYLIKNTNCKNNTNYFMIEKKQKQIKNKNKNKNKNKFKHTNKVYKER